MSAAQSYPFHSTLKRHERIEYPVLVEFRRHLEVDRGVRASDSHVAAATCFLDFLGARGISLQALSKREIDDFVTEQGVHYQKVTVAALAGRLRSFFRFLLVHRLVDKDWAPAVARPRVFEGKRDPRYLKPKDVQRILAAQDRAGPGGQRNYAIFTLLGLYGLRASEVARLTLDDIGWRSRVVRIGRRKCDDAFELPLVPAVAHALVEYLRVRPRHESRFVFLSTTEPHRPLTPQAISTLAYNAIKRAGIEVAHPGSHSFRYATAQVLFQVERPVPEIAAVLGHSDLRSTLGYLSFTVHPLRDVSLNDGEDLA